MIRLDLLGCGQAGVEVDGLGEPLRSFAGLTEASQAPELSSAAVA
jgi:hypothetical protein